MRIQKDDLLIQLYNWPDNADSLSTLNPKEVLIDFFQYYRFDDAHPLLWDLFKFLIENDRINAVSMIKHYHEFLERLSDLCTASYLIAKEHHLETGNKMHTP